MAKKFIFPLVFALSLASYTAYAALDTLVIEKVQGSASFESNFFDDDSSSTMSSIPNSSSSSSSSTNNSTSSKDSSSSSNESSSSSDSNSSVSSTSESSNDNSTSESSNSGSSTSSNSVPVTDDQLFTEVPLLTENSYSDQHINIQIHTETVKVYNKSADKTVDTVVYWADVHLTSIKYMKTALAQDKFGKNIVEQTTTMAERKNAIFAVNGDYYGAQDKGYVLRNGTVFRDVRKSSTTEKGDLAIYTDGSFHTFFEKPNPLNTIQELKLDQGIKCYQVFSFGPVLVLDGEVNVTETDEVATFSKLGNQRTSIGFVDNLHYIFAVCDGRLSDSWGMELYQMANFMKDKGCKIAYNLDGGGSSTIVFNNKLLNRPNTNGDNDIKERKISDCVYIASE